MLQFQQVAPKVQPFKSMDNGVLIAEEHRARQHFIDTERTTITLLWFLFNVGLLGQSCDFPGLRGIQSRQDRVSGEVTEQRENRERHRKVVAVQSLIAAHTDYFWHAPIKFSVVTHPFVTSEPSLGYRRTQLFKWYVVPCWIWEHFYNAQWKAVSAHSAAPWRWPTEPRSRTSCGCTRTQHN